MKNHRLAIGRELPMVYIVQQRKLRDFLADQQRIVAIKSDWLYRLCSPEGREKLVRQAGFTPVRPEASASATSAPTSRHRTSTGEARA